MDEVDKIIIQSLKHIGCDLNEDTLNLKQFDSDMIVCAISSCLESILPNVSLPKKLPPAMIAKLKLASNLAEHIKNIGFRGDMGYQSILYCNEVEIRRVLMFLIERLPRESAKIIPVEQTGYVPRIVKNIERNLKKSLKQMWVPSSFIKDGVMLFEDGYTVRSFGNSAPLDVCDLDIPDPSTSNEALKQYWVNTSPEVTKQCDQRHLIPSLLFRDTEFPRSPAFTNLLENQEDILIQDFDKKIALSTSSENIQSSTNEIERAVKVEHISKEAKSSEIAQEVEVLKSTYVKLKEDITNSKLKLSQAKSMIEDEQDTLKNTLLKIKLKTKTLAIVNNEENKAKQKNLVQSISDRLIDLANQWKEVQTPLLEEYRSLQGSLTTAEANFQRESQKLDDAKQTRMKLTEDLREKIVLEQNLTEKCQQMSKNNNRAAYTQRILEIIVNIRKQNDEIQKFLKDTRDIQKEINTTTGQVDRSFTLADELIFYDCKNDEMSRKAYKLLASLRDDCSDILKAVQELGEIERESRNLQEQIETERSKDIAGKLKRVLSDLAQIEKEALSLVPEK